MAVRCVAGGRSLGFGQFRPVGPEPTADLQRGCLADAPLSAGVFWLLLTGHSGIQGGHLQRLRGGGERAARADKRSQRGLEEKGLKDVEYQKDYVETFVRLRTDTQVSVLVGGRVKMTWLSFRMRWMRLNSEPWFLFLTDMSWTSIITTLHPAVFVCHTVMSFTLDIDQMCFKTLKMNVLMNDFLGYSEQSKKSSNGANAFKVTEWLWKPGSVLSHFVAGGLTDWRTKNQMKDEHMRCRLWLQTTHS